MAGSSRTRRCEWCRYPLPQVHGVLCLGRHAGGYRSSFVGPWQLLERPRSISVLHATVLRGVRSRECPGDGPSRPSCNPALLALNGTGSEWTKGLDERQMTTTSALLNPPSSQPFFRGVSCIIGHTSTRSESYRCVCSKHLNAANVGLRAGCFFCGILSSPSSANLDKSPSPTERNCISDEPPVQPLQCFGPDRLVWRIAGRAAQVPVGLANLMSGLSSWRRERPDCIVLRHSIRHIHERPNSADSRFILKPDGRGGCGTGVH